MAAPVGVEVLWPTPSRRCELKDVSATRAATRESGGNNVESGREVQLLREWHEVQVCCAFQDELTSAAKFLSQSRIALYMVENAAEKLRSEDKNTVFSPRISTTFPQLHKYRALTLLCLPDRVPHVDGRKG